MMGYIWNKEFRISKKGIEEGSEGKYDQSNYICMKLLKLSLKIFKRQ